MSAFKVIKQNAQTYKIKYFNKHRNNGVFCSYELISTEKKTL